MKIFSSKIGEIDIDKNSVITFKEGLLGFEHLKKFVLYEHKPGSLLKWLIPINDRNVSFIIIRPVQFIYNYKLKLAIDDSKFLDIQDANDALIYSIVVVPSDPKKMTANLQGPIVINSKNKIGKQVISSNSKHQLKHYILEEMQKNSQKLKENLAPVNENEIRLLNTPKAIQGGSQ